MSRITFHGTLYDFVIIRIIKDYMQRAVDLYQRREGKDFSYSPGGLCWRHAEFCLQLLVVFRQNLTTTQKCDFSLERQLKTLERTAPPARSRE